MLYKGIQIRTELRPGDIGYVTYLHGSLYSSEYDYGISFEAYVAQGLYEFYKNYDADRDRVWVCEKAGAMVGFLLLMHREENVAQLRYFILTPEVRGIGLGNKLMERLHAFLLMDNA
jgi:peptidyl-dipeptidase Dcp